MKKNKSILVRFFSHNIVLMIMSFLLAFTIWFFINLSSETDTNVTISGIPITVELSASAEEDGLMVFNANDLTASVEVAGNRVTVGSLAPTDIQVVANQTGSIIAPGTYTLPLSAKKSGLKTNYNIVSSVTPSSVSVLVDRLSEEEYDIEDRIKVELSDSSHYASTSLSQNSVNVSGPESQVSLIASVAVENKYTVDSDATRTVQEKIKYFDADGNELDLPLVTADAESVEATITVLPVMSVALEVETIGMPDNCPPIRISPDTVKIAGSQSALNDLAEKKIVLGVLDFSKLKNENYDKTYDITAPTGCKVISGDTEATVSVDLSSYTVNTVSCKISSKIDSTKYNVDFNADSVMVTVYGPEDVVSGLTSGKVTVVADFTDLLGDVTKDNAVSLSVPLKLKLSNGYSECWIFGAYSAAVNVSMK